MITYSADLSRCIDAQTRLVKGAWTKVRKPEALFIFTYKYLFIEKTIKAQTNLSQMWLSHWSLGLWVGDDDSDPRQDLLKERDADRAKTKNSFFEKVNKR